VPADPDAFECFHDPVSTKIKHCCDADTQDLDRMKEDPLE
jgi:hypothetical protein